MKYIVRKVRDLILFVVCLSALTLPLDQWLKHSARKNFLAMEDSDDTTIYQGRRQEILAADLGLFWVGISETYVRNHGASWGFWGGIKSNFRVFALVTAGLVATMGLFWGAIKLSLTGYVWSAYALCGVIAGSFGNILDRLRLGYVVDFLTIKFGITTWSLLIPSFNLADIIIVLSLILLITTMHLKADGGTSK